MIQLSGYNHISRLRKLIVNFAAIALVFALSVPSFTANAKEEKKKIAFTFDDGPSDYTEKILDFCEENGARVTFFVLGSRVEKYKDTVVRMKTSGCEIGCHGYAHKDMRREGNAELKSEIEKSSEIIKNVCGEYPKLLRAPYGEFTKSAKEIPMHKIKWSVDTVDWRTKNSLAVKNAILSAAKDGDIVLLHDIFKTSAEGFTEAAKVLLDEGYELCTVSELLSLEGKKADDTVYYSKK